MTIRPRHNRKRYGWFRVSRRGYQWTKVTVHLPFFREWIVWERAR